MKSMKIQATFKNTLFGTIPFEDMEWHVSQEVIDAEPLQRVKDVYVAMNKIPVSQLIASRRLQIKEDKEDKSLEQIIVESETEALEAVFDKPVNDKCGGCTEANNNLKKLVKNELERRGHKCKDIPILIPEYLRSMGFQELTGIILATGDREGLAFAENERVAVDAADCTICRRTEASRRLRKWIVDYRNANDATADKKEEEENDTM